MRCIIELDNGEWLDGSSPSHIAGTDDVAHAKVFESPAEARKWMRHLGVLKYDVWSEDGETWIEDRYYVQGVGLTDGKDLSKPIEPRTSKQEA